MSVSSVGLAFSVGDFCFSLSVLCKSRKLKGLALRSLYQGTVSHFRLDYGWQVKENKNGLYWRDEVVLFHGTQNKQRDGSKN